MNTAAPAAQQRLNEIQDQIGALYAERERVCREHPDLAPHDILTREERYALADAGFRFDAIAAADLAPAMKRARFKGDGLPAYLSLDEAQIIFAYRFIKAGRFGRMSVKTHEQKRVEISATIDGK